MRMSSSSAAAAVAGLLLGASAQAQEAGLAKPNLVLRQRVEAMPRETTQEVRILTATFKPGDRTVRHSHRFPVTVYVIEGAFTLELKGQPAVVVKAGEAYVEPPHVEMVGYNRSAIDSTKVVIFYVSGHDAPFLDPLH
ncbi:cupin domain-containing protein [Bosea psychrotolerans]|uniref:Quercetin dioxygenase-like cupin family protein n=1 Tax=Bosea psychrotolerans TaxID=1871628 RepID=A0A2S4MRM6_9HYPH|nr:cupin domain-containing protein [Bosea psychrotolerans]POR56937.1 quercetin dioxygenase-like cupin family protein [Bosea psychrotolerans]